MIFKVVVDYVEAKNIDAARTKFESGEVDDPKLSEVLDAEVVKVEAI